MHVKVYIGHQQRCASEYTVHIRIYLPVISCNIPGVGLGQSAGEGVIDTEGVAPTITVLVVSSVLLGVHTHLDDDAGDGEGCWGTDGAVLVERIVPSVVACGCTRRMLNRLYRFVFPEAASRGSASHCTGVPSS